MKLDNTANIKKKKQTQDGLMKSVGILSIFAFMW